MDMNSPARPAKTPDISMAIIFVFLTPLISSVVASRLHWARPTYSAVNPTALGNKSIPPAQLNGGKSFRTIYKVYYKKSGCMSDFFRIFAAELMCIYHNGRH